MMEHNLRSLDSSREMCWLRLTSEPDPAPSRCESFRKESDVIFWGIVLHPVAQLRRMVVPGSGRFPTGFPTPPPRRLRRAFCLPAHRSHELDGIRSVSD